MPQLHPLLAPKDKKYCCDCINVRSKYGVNYVREWSCAHPSNIVGVSLVDKTLLLNLTAEQRRALATECGEEGRDWAPAVSNRALSEVVAKRDDSAALKKLRKQVTVDDI